MKNAMKDGFGPDTTATVSPQQKHVFEASVFRAGESWCVGRQRLKFTEKSAACSGAHQRRELPYVCVGVCVGGTVALPLLGGHSRAPGTTPALPPQRLTYLPC